MKNTKIAIKSLFCHRFYEALDSFLMSLPSAEREARIVDSILIICRNLVMEPMYFIPHTTRSNDDNETCPDREAGLPYALTVPIAPHTGCSS